MLKLLWWLVDGFRQFEEACLLFILAALWMSGRKEGRGGIVHGLTKCYVHPFPILLPIICELRSFFQFGWQYVPGDPETPAVL